MPYVNIKIAKGRTGEQKKALVKSISDARCSFHRCRPRKGLGANRMNLNRDNFCHGRAVAVR